jgi:hypothetical protein
MLKPDQSAAERGSITVFVVVFAIAVVFLTGLILDGGIALNARERAVDIAGQAARAAAGDIDLTTLEGGGKPVIGPGACARAQELIQQYAAIDNGGVDKVDSAEMVMCNAPVGSETAKIEVRITTTPIVGVLGGFTEYGTDTAFTECGINAGGEC